MLCQINPIFRIAVLIILVTLSILWAGGEEPEDRSQEGY